jgi:hypothetical protein
LIQAGIDIVGKALNEHEGSDLLRQRGEIALHVGGVLQGVQHLASRGLHLGGHALQIGLTGSVVKVFPPLSSARIGAPWSSHRYAARLSGFFKR